MRLKMYAAGLLTLTVLAGVASVAPGENLPAADPPCDVVVAAPAELQEIRTQLLESVRSGEVPSFAIGVVRGRELLWEEALGWADREAEIPATPWILYQVASVSKSITATGVMTLVSKGRLKLDEPVAAILGDTWPEAETGDVSTSHLMAHTSGIPHLWNYEYLDRPETLVPRSRLIRENAFIALPAGEHYLYSNLGYGILAEIIEKKGGAPFQSVMERILFEPLDMRLTTSDTWAGEEGTARGYTGDGKPIPYCFRLSPDGGAGFFSSVHDLIQYAVFHLGAMEGNSLPEGASITADPAILHREGLYFRGWGVIALDDATVLISDGQAAGGTATVILVPEKQLGVVVLCNATGGPVIETAIGVLSALVPGFGEQFGTAVNSIMNDLSAPGKSPDGLYEGKLLDGTEALEVALDFSDPEKPLLILDQGTYTLQGMNWERGALQISTAGPLSFGADWAAKHRITFDLWLLDDGIRGIARKEFDDDRLRYGIPLPLDLQKTR